MFLKALFTLFSHTKFILTGIASVYIVAVVIQITKFLTSNNRFDYEELLREPIVSIKDIIDIQAGTILMIFGVLSIVILAIILFFFLLVFVKMGVVRSINVTYEPIKIMLHWNVLVGSTIIILLVSALLSLHFVVEKDHLPTGSGGIIGDITKDLFLIISPLSLVNVLIYFLLTLNLVFFYNLKFFNFFEFIGKRVLNLFKLDLLKAFHTKKIISKFEYKKKKKTSTEKKKEKKITNVYEKIENKLNQNRLYYLNKQKKNSNIDSNFDKINNDLETKQIIDVFDTDNFTVESPLQKMPKEEQPMSNNYMSDKDFKGLTQAMSSQVAREITGKVNKEKVDDLLNEYQQTKDQFVKIDFSQEEGKKDEAENVLKFRIQEHLSQPEIHTKINSVVLKEPINPQASKQKIKINALNRTLEQIKNIRQKTVNELKAMPNNSYLATFYNNKIAENPETNPLKNQDIQIENLNNYLDVQYSLINDYVLPDIEELSLFEQQIGEEFLSQNEKLNYSLILENYLVNLGVSSEVFNVIDYEYTLSFEVKLENFNQVSIINQNLEGIKEIMKMTVNPVISTSTVDADTIEISFKKLKDKDISVREVIQSLDKSKYILPIIFGKNHQDKNIIGDLARMNNMLIGGIKSTGKTNLMHVIFTSLIFNFSPKYLKLLLYSTELNQTDNFNHLPHLYDTIANNESDLLASLTKLRQELDDRLKLFDKLEVNNIEGFNQKIANARQNINYPDINYTVQINNQTISIAKLKPFEYIIIGIDDLQELARTMKYVQVENVIKEVSSVSIFTGVYFIMASSSTDDLSKYQLSNFSTRVAFKLATNFESQSLIEEDGADQLSNKAEMLINIKLTYLLKINVAKVQSKDTLNLVNFWIKQKPQDNLTDTDEQGSVEANFVNDTKQVKNPEELLYDVAINFIKSNNLREINQLELQNQFKIGYNKATNLIVKLISNSIIEEVMDEDGNRNVKI